MLIESDPIPHICMRSVTALPPMQCGMGAWLQFVYVSKSTFSRSILLLEFPYPLDFFTFHSTIRYTDDVQLERLVSELVGALSPVNH